jgi:hypothetical protein
MGEPERRRRRLRPPSSATPPPEAPAAEEATRETMTGPPVDDPPEPEPVPQRPTRPPPRPASGAGLGGDHESERGLRGLVGSGSSQVSVGAALRARDAARPTDAQLADADENLTIVRRNWTPREDLPRRV